MKTPALAAAIAFTAMATPALADHHQEGEPQAQDEEEAPLAEVLKRDENGRATLIRVEGQEYVVCGEGQQDGCINPREAGLDFGGVPIDYWPGRPASEIDEPLPAHRPPQDD
ncbi:hypothetical protein OZN62_00335 [Aurantiacibacter sp. MUD11]|uniref:hypothetical protein n=1 Tax=Aurantiacibacter sp. MUD11 TaxID=3003265 RepID=UPI0022A9FAAF|nr:hypothetical protein [Aurantiacibacter sp. MUD11]WAT18058.1 hypothetical protein OZN62_00335 [Aurantiacibacter sp. MUD11]